MFERLTDQATRVIMLAQEEASRLGHNRVGTEVLLLGLIAQDTGGVVSRATDYQQYAARHSQPTVAKVLKSMGVNLTDARGEVEKLIGHGSDKIAAKVPFSPGAEQLLQSSWREAQNLGVNYIATTHLLLGLLRQGDSDEHALAVLEHFGVDLAKLEEQLIEVQGEDKNEGVPYPRLHSLGLQDNVRCKVEKILREGYEVSVGSMQPKGFMSNRFRNGTVSLKRGDVVDATYIGDSELWIPQFQFSGRDKEE